MKIRLPYDKFCRRVSKIGSPEIDVHSLKIENGVSRLVCVGKKNIQDIANSYKESCDIYKLLGDFCAVNGSLPEVVVTDQVIDYSAVPTSVFEVQDMVDNVKNYYAAMPDTVKSEYKTFNAFLKAMNTEASVQKISDLLKNKGNVNTESEVENNVESQSE